MLDMKPLTAGEIAKEVIKVMTERGFSCWRNNNIAVPGRKFIGRKGVSDIAGFNKSTGLAMYVEVKAWGDKLSDDQVKFFSEVMLSGAVALVAYGDKYGSYELKACAYTEK